MENKMINGIRATRYIASWNNILRKHHRVGYPSELWDWLKSFGLSDEDAGYILEMYSCGKLELEKEAERFLNNH